MTPSDFEMVVEADIDEMELEISVSVKCPHCPISFQGPRETVEENLFFHLWRSHEEKTLDYILNNMYIPQDLRESIFSELGPEYVSWVVDTEGEINDTEEE